MKLEIEQGEAIEFLRRQPALSIDAVVTDPPYFLPAQHYNTEKKWPRSLADVSILEHFFRDLFAEFARVTKPTSPWIVFCDGQTYPIFYSLMYPHKDRLIDVVWDKIHIGMGSGIRRQHEWILLGTTNQTWNGQCPSVIQEKRVHSSRTHPAEKPVALMRKLIVLTTQPGDLVVDPFSGSCSTGEAAVLEGRRFLGCELDQRYAQDANTRVRSAQDGLELS